jgi:glutathione S-transferase
MSAVLLLCSFRRCPYAIRAHPVLTDAAVFPFVRQFAGVEPLWWASSPFPAVRAWLTAWLESPQFKAAMQKPTAPKPEPSHG